MDELRKLLYDEVVKDLDLTEEISDEMLYRKIDAVIFNEGKKRKLSGRDRLKYRNVMLLRIDLHRRRSQFLASSLGFILSCDNRYDLMAALCDRIKDRNCQIGCAHENDLHRPQSSSSSYVTSRSAPTTLSTNRWPSR